MGDGTSAEASGSRVCLRRHIALLGIAALGLLGSLGAAPAAAAPVWNLDVHHHETNFPPGGTGEYWLDVRNHSGSYSSGTITLTVDLPPGLTRASVRHNHDAEITWSCPGSPGDTSVVCTTTDTFRPWQFASGLMLTVDVDPAATGELLTTASIEGGGTSAAATASELTSVSGDPPGFGIVPGSLRADFFGSDGLTPVRQSGAHPFEAAFVFDLNSVAEPKAENPEFKRPVGTLRNLQFDLPPGFAGDLTAVSECTPAELLAFACPPSSQVGRVDFDVVSLDERGKTSRTARVYNMEHARGAVASLAFNVSGQLVHIKASLDPANNYSVRTNVSNINETLALYGQKITIWGVPADARHDWERCINLAEPCPTDAPEEAFLTLPSRCDVDHVMKLHRYSSWQNSDVFGPDVVYEMPGRIEDCDIPHFEPGVEVQRTSRQANTPTGMEVRIELPQNESVNGLATPPIKRVRVTLPEGMTVSPSAADGLGACSSAQIGLGTNDPVRCPDSSRIGVVTLSTPLLPGELRGSVYLAAQGDNPFDAPFAIYVVIHDVEERGILVKLPGRLDLDPSTGQITSVFDDLPQLPFEDLRLRLRSGARAPLLNPPTCGTKTIEVSATSYAQPQSPVDLRSTYEVNAGPNGAGCPSALHTRPFSPQMDAGTLNPVAGVFSPFLFRLTRGDQDQEVSRVSTTLPPGLVAKIAGASMCSAAAIASVSSAEGTARREAQHPSCPGSSRLGTVNVGLGAGSSPNYVPGKVYLAGPYKGAPLSLAVVVPGLAGPYDLGSVVVRAAIFVDAKTAQVNVVTDPLPTIFHGVLLRVRDLRLNVDRPETMLNPTSCNPMSVDARVAAANAMANLVNRFQVGGCRALGFKPRLGLRLFGGIRRGAYQALRAVIRPRPGDANISRTVVRLPRSAFLAQEHIRTVCTRVQFAAEKCPEGAIYGRAIAYSPLLDFPLRGNVYLRSSRNILPDLVADLRGPAHQPLRIELVGRTDSVKGTLRSTFNVVPDAPVSYFRLQLLGGERGLLVNSRNICRGKNRAVARLDAHNGRRQVLRPVVGNPLCKKIRRKLERRRAAARKRRTAKPGRGRGSKRRAALARAPQPALRAILGRWR